MVAKRGVLAVVRGWSLVIAVVAVCGTTATLEAGPSSSLMDISTDGRLLVCTNRDSGTATVIDLGTHEKLREIRLGKKPEGVTFLGDTHQFAAAVYAEDKIVLADADNGAMLGEIPVFDEPYGIVSSADGRRLFATLDYPGQVIEIDVASKAVTRSTEAGQFLRGLALSPDGARLYATEYYTGVVKVLEAESGEVLHSWAGASSDNLARQIVLHPTLPKAYLPHMRSRVAAAHGEGSIFPYVTVMKTDPEHKGKRTRIPMDAFRGALVTANPWEGAISPDGKQFYVVFAGTDDMFACEVLEDDYKEIKYRQHMPVGRNPRAVKVAPDNRTFYVYNALDFNIAAYDAGSLRKVATIPVCDNPLSEELHLGKVLFYSAQQPMVGRRWISCSSCHPDGDTDGRTWQNPEGLRNTQALAGMAWTHPIHWSADRDEVQDFEVTIRGQLMQGRGLIEGKVNPELGPPNKGLSQALDALAAYCNSHSFALSPHAKGGLSEAARRGRELFFSSETKCATCHGGPLYTDSVSGRKSPMHDVGTGHDDPSEKIGPTFDTPTLLGVYRTAPYLHHGKAATLEEVLTTANPDDRHGKTSHLSKPQIADLIEFLKALPYEDPIPAARQAGIVPVER